MQNFLEAALKYNEAGLRVVPYYYGMSDGKKTQYWAAWAVFQKNEQTAEDVKKMFEKLPKPAEGISLVCGALDIEAIDIDTKHDDERGTIISEFCARVEQEEGGAALLQKLVVQRSKSGGRHYVYRAANKEGSQKLATRAGQKEAVIETRGAGGILNIVPSPGYSIEQGNLLDIPEITPEERNILILAARELDERVKAEPEPESAPKAVLSGTGGGTTFEGGTKPGDAFNASKDVLDLLLDAGWKIKSKGGDYTRLTRPDAKTGGVDGSVINSKGIFKPFTTSTQYDTGKCYDAFAVYAMEQHRGDFSEAAKDLFSKGFGTIGERTPAPTTGAQSPAPPPAPAKLYGAEGRVENVFLVQNRESVDAAKEAGLLGVVATEGALSGADISAALKAGAKHFTVCYGKGRERDTFRAVETLLRHQEATGAAYWTFVADIGENSLEALLRAPGGIDAAKKAMAWQVSTTVYLAEYFAYTRAEEIAKQYTGGALGKDLLRPYLKEELTFLWRLLPASETDYFEDLLSDAIRGYFLTWEGIRHDAGTLKEIEGEKRYRQEAAAAADKAALLFKEGKQEAAEEMLKEIGAAKSRAGAAKFAPLHHVRTEAALRESIINAPPTLVTSYKITTDGKTGNLKLPAGGLSIFAGRPGHGKSRVLVNLALDVCANYEGQVHYFTFEEAAEAVTIKALNCFLNSDFSRLGDNKEALEAYFRGDKDAIGWGQGNFEAQKNAFFALIEERRLNIHFAEMQAETLADAIRHLHQRGNVAAVFIDYIQLLTLAKPGRGINNRQEEVKAICGILNDVARETRLPLVLAAQFNRDVKRAEDLSMSALREAGDIEQYAALVVGLWNRFEDREPAPELEVKILKNRGGAPKGSAVWKYNGNRYKVYSGEEENKGAGENENKGTAATQFKLKK